MMSAHSSGLLPPEEFADLHIFVVPLELWLEKYRTAFNNIALESVSAGFVRVLPYVSLYALRDHIEEQLGPEVIPEDYVFLRSVGRCMAVVKENQERLLKAKDFLPPVAYSPEVFVLPGTHDAVARPVPDAYNTVIATHGATTAGMASTQPFHLPTIAPGYPQNPQVNARAFHNGNNVFHQEGQMRDVAARNAVEGNSNPYQLNNKSYELQSENDTGSDDSGSSGDRMQVVNGRHQSENDGSAELSENDGVGKSKKTISKGKHRSSNQGSHNEPQVERSESRKNEDSLKTEKPKLQKRTGSDSSGSIQSGTKTVKFIQPEVYQSLAVPSQGGQLVSPPTPIPSGRVISSPLPAPQSDLVSAVERNDDQKREDRNRNGVVPLKDSLSDEPKTVKKKKKARPRSPSNDRAQTKEESADLKAADFKAADSDDHNNLPVSSEVAIGGSDSLPSLNEVEERSKFVQFPSPMKGERRSPVSYTYDLQYSDETGQDLSSSYQNENSFGNEDDHSNMLQNDSEGQHSAVQENGAESGNFEESGGHNNVQLADGQEDTSRGNGENTRKADNPKHGKENRAQVPIKGKKTVKKTVKKNPETLDEKFKIPKVPSPPPVKYPQRNSKELEKDTASAKDRKCQEIENLKAELRKAKNSRVDMEKERESKMRRAKMLQNQILQQRNHAKNIWKKKFFDEKRKTASLEEQVNRLRYEVDVQHKTLMSYLETKEREGNKAQQGPEFKNPSEKTNQRMSLARLQHEVEELKSRIEELKMKLTAEMKKRDAAQKELKQIREDLMEKKINLTLTKSQKSLATLTGQENIAV